MKQMRLESKRETVCASSGKEAVMLIGKVTGSVVSTRKSENLIGSKFMIIDVLKPMGGGQKQLVAVDKIGAGIGEYVLVALGSAARIGNGLEHSSVDAAVVGIIDDGAGLEQFAD